MIQISQQQLERRWDEAPDEIRDGIFSDENNDELDRIGVTYTLNRQQEKDLAYLCLVTFLGFITTKDVYNQLLEFFGGNAKSAYDVYVLLDVKLFGPVKGQIEAFRKTHWIPDEQADVQLSQTKVEPPRMEQRVDLKKRPEKDAVNLKTEEIKKVESEPGPVVVSQVRSEKLEVRSEQKEQVPAAVLPTSNFQPLTSQPKLFSPHDFHLRGEKWAVSSEKTQSSQSVTQNPQPTTQNLDEGPIILHKKEESIPIAEANRYKEYKNISAGGFLGSFGSIFNRKREQQNQAPRASVEIPEAYTENRIPYTESGKVGEKVPVKVKNFGDERSNVQYSDYRTYLKQRDQS
ncbi:hypothetical protein A2755_03435 [Candidatus Wolfebacteria bacterium RIFCSPHIGHO2_01_FULL_48_22]|uniref:Uncharacterized protein n=2 Tax=Candidatus Wolfeibacteriota TaxID=1752735 RepID=A0A1F8DPN4_9BACT|nr:MAG: hypothetical protein A2755_03435 [Candidatus Wolfebacteria bacterium RIFCSPHIGHO2_01_FULL_48_22]OGM92080.1 MAG: hypothetical protein A2935_01925 [Candidatus Wolfebacteria bacterium RIFCSPLOWO2_01_FULL_47_17b]